MYTSLLSKRFFGASVGLMTLAGALIAPASAFASPVRQQQLTGIWGVNDDNGGSGNCVSPSTATFTLNFVHSGALIIAGIGYKGAYTSTVPAPTDSEGNTYSLIVSNGVNAGSNSSRSMAMYSTVAQTGGTMHFTVECPPNQGNANMLPQVVISEVVGQDSTSPIRHVLGGTGNSASPNFGILSTSLWSSGNLFLADLMSVNEVGTPSTDTGWNQTCVQGSLKGSICTIFKSLDSSDVNTTFGALYLPSSKLYAETGVVIQ